MVGINQAVKAIQDAAAELTPVPTHFERVISAADLKARLDWGEPALTIIDVRDRNHFNAERITGAVSLPLPELVNRAREALERNRDIYVYADTDEQTSAAVLQLDTAGFERVAALKGGLPGWKAVDGPVEGRIS